MFYIAKSFTTFTMINKYDRICFVNIMIKKGYEDSIHFTGKPISSEKMHVTKLYHCFVWIFYLYFFAVASAEHEHDLWF